MFVYNTVICLIDIPFWVQRFHLLRDRTLQSTADGPSKMARWKALAARGGFQRANSEVRRRSLSSIAKQVNTGVKS